MSNSRDSIIIEIAVNILKNLSYAMANLDKKKYQRWRKSLDKTVWVNTISVLIDWLIDFYIMSTHPGWFYAWRLGNHIDSTCIFTFFV